MSTFILVLLVYLSFKQFLNNPHYWSEQYSSNDPVVCVSP